MLAVRLIAEHCVQEISQAHDLACGICLECMLKIACCKLAFFKELLEYREQ